jgi:hypothetical protein
MFSSTGSISRVLRQRHVTTLVTGQTTAWKVVVSKQISADVTESAMDLCSFNVSVNGSTPDLTVTYKRFRHCFRGSPGAFVIESTSTDKRLITSHLMF